MKMPRVYTFDVPDFDDCGGRTMRRVEVPKAVFRQIEADVAAPLEATIHQLGENAAKAAGEYAEEVGRLREWALKAFTVVEWCVGEGFIIDPPHYDPDDCLIEGVAVLGVETTEEAIAALTEPTEGMVEVGYDQTAADAHRDECADIYRAMLSARHLIAYRSETMNEEPQFGILRTPHQGRMKYTDAKAGLDAANRVRTKMWSVTPATGLEAAIARFKRDLPGWWYRVCECQLSCDATCAPTGEVEGWRELCAYDERFNSGFDADLLQPSSLAEALDAVRIDALKALAARPTEG